MAARPDVADDDVILGDTSGGVGFTTDGARVATTQRVGDLDGRSVKRENI